MNALEGPVYHPIPPGADWLTRLSYRVEWLSVATEGRMHLLVLLGPPLFTIACLIAARLTRRWPWIAWLARAAAVVAPVVALRPFFFSTWVLAKGQLAVLAIPYPLALWRGRGKRTVAARLYRGTVWATFLLALLPFGNVAASYNRTHECERVQADSRVRFLFSFCDPSWEKTFHEVLGADAEIHARESRSIAVSDDGRFAFLGVGYEDEPAVWPYLVVDRASGAIVKAEPHRTIFDIACVPGSGRCFGSQAWESAIHVLDQASQSWVEALRAPFKPRFLAVDPVRGRLVLTGALGVQLAFLDARTLAFDDVSALAPLRSPASSAAYDPVRDRVFVTGELHSRTSLKYATGPDYRFESYVSPVMDWLHHMGTSVGLQLDPETRELFIAYTFTGEVGIFDVDGVVPKGSIQLQTGLRELAYDRTRKVLYAGNFLTGDIHVVDVPTRREIDRIFVGRLIRQITWAPAIDRLLVTSANGFLEVDPRLPGSAPAIQRLHRLTPELHDRLHLLAE